MSPTVSGNGAEAEVVTAVEPPELVALLVGELGPVEPEFDPPDVATGEHPEPIWDAAFNTAGVFWAAPIWRTDTWP